MLQQTPDCAGYICTCVYITHQVQRHGCSLTQQYCLRVPGGWACHVRFLAAGGWNSDFLNANGRTHGWPVLDTGLLQLRSRRCSGIRSCCAAPARHLCRVTFVQRWLCMHLPVMLRLKTATTPHVAADTPLFPAAARVTVGWMCLRMPHTVCHRSLLLLWLHQESERAYSHIYRFGCGGVYYRRCV